MIKKNKNGVDLILTDRLYCFGQESDISGFQWFYFLLP